MRKLSLVVASSAVGDGGALIVGAQDKDLVETALAASLFKTFTRTHRRRTG
ncbi:MAG: hypothetical protein IPP90_10550 [Gemmatimonadaceae bacterium]|nr:hypothetical protein [Gemmatimonadaceae bacterium]